MLLGKGYKYDEQSGQTTKWTSGQVWQYWRLIPTALELTIRRVKWYQDIARWPLANAQVLTALFGHFPGSDPTLNEEKKVTTPVLPGDDCLYAASTSCEFRYFFQHNIANKIKNKDPDAMAAISLLKDSN